MNDESPTSIKQSRTVSISENGFPDADGEFEPDELDDFALRGVERFRMIKLIGHGGMGVVMKARDTDFDRDVALKVLLKTHFDNPEMHRRFFDEAQVTGQLQHPGIVSVYQMGSSSDGRPYFAMRLIEGKTLADLLQQSDKSTLELARLLNIYARVCQTIAYTHSRGIIHLDLKPANVMVGAFGEVHVMDWGLSRRVDDLVTDFKPGLDAAIDLGSDSSSRITGTPAYMPPEQARGRSIGLHSDVFGLGAVLCEILTGQPPFVGKNVRQIYRRAVNASLYRAFERLDACAADPSIIALAKCCLAPEASKRPDDAGVIAAEITGYLESSMERAQRDLCRFFEISPDLFCIASLDGYFKRVNSNFSRVLGYSDQELVSRPFLDFIHPDDVEDTQRAVLTLSEGKPLAEFRNRYRDSQGHYRWFEWTAKPIPEENVVFAIARDVTDEIKNSPSRHAS